MRRIDIVPDNCPADKVQKQKTLVIAVAKMMEEYLASQDDSLAVGLSILGTVIANTHPALRGDLYNRLGQQLMLSIQVAEHDERREP